MWTYMDCKFSLPPECRGTEVTHAQTYFMAEEASSVTITAQGRLLVSDHFHEYDGDLEFYVSLRDGRAFDIEATFSMGRIVHPKDGAYPLRVSGRYLPAEPTSPPHWWQRFARVQRKRT